MNCILGGTVTRGWFCKPTVTDHLSAVMKWKLSPPVSICNDHLDSIEHFMYGHKLETIPTLLTTRLTSGQKQCNVISSVVKFFFFFLFLRGLNFSFYPVNKVLSSFGPCLSILLVESKILCLLALNQLQYYGQPRKWFYCI